MSSLTVTIVLLVHVRHRVRHHVRVRGHVLPLKGLPVRPVLPDRLGRLDLPGLQEFRVLEVSKDLLVLRGLRVFKVQQAPRVRKVLRALKGQSELLDRLGQLALLV